MSTYRPAESTARIQVALMQTARRYGEQKALRKQLNTARKIGLARRHRDKEKHMTTRRVPPEDRDRLQELERLAHTARTGEVAAETELERYFRLTDEGLQTAIRNLRRLRDIPAARDALKLVRQAQNLLMDAEDAA